ncbi:MAG: arsenate reductase family protein [Elusimicrobia bacterium]|nr:arsenate reductase family protein [Elusimicrobiota bacterium]
MKVIVYEYAKCSTCRKALKFLDERGVAYDARPIVDAPPTRAELSRMLGHVGGDVRRLFNVSGELYREMKLSEKMKTISPDEAIALLAKHGKLVKRPFVLVDAAAGLVGFDPKAWAALFPIQR